MYVKSLLHTNFFYVLYITQINHFGQPYRLNAKLAGRTKLFLQFSYCLSTQVFQLW